MKKIILASAVLLSILPTAALAVPMCDKARYGYTDRLGNVLVDEQQAAALVEHRLRAHGIDGHDSRFWNNCLQTFVTDANGHDEMRFFDPDSLQELTGR